MATRSWISDEQWVRLKAVLASQPRRGRPGNDDRRFFEAVVWWRRTGVPWRDLPEEFGPWKTVFNRFDRWSKNGRWHEVLSALQTDIDPEWQSIDSTTNRAHQHAAGGKGPALHGIGRSRGGLTTKVHLVVDGLGLPLAFEVTDGNRHDIVPAPGLVLRTRPRCLLGDKAYSSREFRALLDEIACQPVIPSSSSWIAPPPYDKDLYKARAEIECTFSLLKQARRFATRYEKTLRNYAAVVAIGCALLWLRI